MTTPTDHTMNEPAQFLKDCIFYHANMDGRGAGWYIELRSGYTYGPFPDKDVAQTILEGVLKRLNAGNTDESDDRQHAAG